MSSGETYSGKEVDSSHHQPSTTSVRVGSSKNKRTDRLFGPTVTNQSAGKKNIWCSHPQSPKQTNTIRPTVFRR